MNAQQLDHIPDDLLAEPGTGSLRDYLWDRGLRMTLAELDAERRTRCIAVDVSQTRRQRRRTRHTT